MSPKKIFILYISLWNTHSQKLLRGTLNFDMIFTVIINGHVNLVTLLILQSAM